MTRAVAHARLHTRLKFLWRGFYRKPKTDMIHRDGRSFLHLHYILDNHFLS